MTFARPANNRHIDFDEIATKTGIPLNEVEILAMKAMSLGLVRGTIDQVTNAGLLFFQLNVKINNKNLAHIMTFFCHIATVSFFLPTVTNS